MDFRSTDPALHCRFRPSLLAPQRAPVAWPQYIERNHTSGRPERRQFISVASAP